MDLERSRECNDHQWVLTTIYLMIVYMLQIITGRKAERNDVEGPAEGCLRVRYLLRRDDF